MTSSFEQVPPDAPRPSAKAAERLAVIVDAAERAALAVIDDAEREAQQYLEDAQARADLIVAEALRERADRLEREAAPNGAAPREPLLRDIAVPDSGATMPPPPPVAIDGGGTQQSAGGSAAARLLATQMAVTGSSREEIAMRLRNGFQIEDSGEILDAILGPEGG